MNNYTFKDDDDFQRKSFAESLIKLIKNDDPLFPIAINGRWGTGKTTFILKTIDLIKREHNTTLEPIYFDAFSEDFYNDPITSIFTKIYSHLNIKDHESFFNISSAISLACGTLGTVADFFLPALRKIPDTVNEIAQTVIKDKIEQKSRLNNQIIELDEIIKNSIGNKKLILFIDELDRCRPNYSLHLLEVIKHIFSINSLKIIFIINQSQLIDVIKVNYGHDKTLAQKYFDKFFQLTLSLPETFYDNQNNLHTNSEAYIKQEIQKYDLLTTCPLIHGEGETEVLCLLTELSKHYHLSLRDIDKFTKTLLVYTMFSESRTSKFPREETLPGVKLIKIFGILQYSISGTFYQNLKKFGTPFREFSDPSGYRNPEFFYYTLIITSFYVEFDETLKHIFPNSIHVYNLDNRRAILEDTFDKLERLT